MSSPERPQVSLASLATEVARTFEARIVTANLPVHRASTVLFDTLAEAWASGAAAQAGERHRSTYATAGTPTTFALMDAVSALEAPGHAVRTALMPSGLSAITTALLAYLKPGDRVLASDSVYGPMRVFSEGTLARLGIEVEWFAPDAGAELADRFDARTRLVYLESPGSYTFELQDVPAICAAARERGILTMIDNAWGSPGFARPFDWGVDVSVLPLTKYWSGHADVLMGAVVVREPLWPALWAMVRQLGVCVGGDDAWLILRGMRTADVRMRRQQETALAVAQWLERRPDVARVLHPGLPTHPQHARWRRDFHGASGLFSFECARTLGPRALAALCEGRRFFRIGYSWGGYESLVMPARLGSLRTLTPWTGGTLVRLHCGLEDPQDLIDDLEQGLEAAAGAGD